MREVSTGVNFAAVPVTLATLALTIPYYGLVVAKRLSSYESKQVFPMESGSINTRLGESSGTTCTGEFNDRLFGSLHVLGNMNIESMYFYDTVPPDYHNFVEACIQFSAMALAIKEKE